MTNVFRAGNPNFPANQAELDMRLKEIEQLVNKPNANIEFCLAAFKLIEDCDLITENNVRFLCSAQACKKYDPDFWFIRNRSEGVLRPTKDYDNVFSDDARRFYSGSDMRVEFYEQHFLIVNDWYKDFSINRNNGQIKPSPCPNKRAFYNWLAKKSQDACEKHWEEQKSEIIVPDSLDIEFKYSRIDSGIRIDRYRGSAKYVTIPARIDNLPVSEIGYGAFWGRGALKSIEIPHSVTIIGNKAFRGCYKLTKITIPEGVKKISDSTFSWCKSLAEIKIPNGVRSIGDLAFWHCKSLTNVKIPDSVTYIGDKAFESCENLKSIIIPESVTFIGNGVFDSCTRGCW